MTTTTARMTVRKGNLADMPKLLPGEFGLAQDIQRLFIGQAIVNGTCQISNSDDITAKVEFTSANGDPIDLDLIDNLDEYTYGITVNGGPIIPGQDITFTDAVASFSHELKDTSTTNAGAFLVGKKYVIETVGDTDFTLIGSANNDVGTVFTATGIGSGTGTATGLRNPTANDVFELYYNKEVGFHAEAFPNPVQYKDLTKETADSAGPKESEIKFICANKDKITIDYSLKTASASRHGQLTILVDDNAGVPTTSSIKDEYDISTGAMPLVFSLLSNSADSFKLMFDTTELDTVHTFKYVQKSF